MYQIECSKYLKHISFGSPEGDLNISNEMLVTEVELT